MRVRAHECNIYGHGAAQSCFVYFQTVVLVTQSTDQVHEHHLFNVKIDVCLVQRCWVQQQLS